MEKEKWQSEYEDVLQEMAHLVLYNDDFNTFDHVIESLVEICNHNPIQAEQCAMIVHFKGKCAVKSGDYNELLAMHRQLSDRDLTVEINC